MTYTDRERREFFRLNYTQPLQYKISDSKNAAAASASAKNISQTGILFRTEDSPPQISSLLWLNVDIRTLKICQEIESKALIFNNGVLGKVVRVEEDTKHGNTYDVGVCFLRKDQKDSREVQQILNTLA